MKFFLVDVKSITPSKPLEQFDKAEVEKLADLILECNGLLKPLVLKPTGPESYVVIQGDMEFHAAVRAREKDPRKGEMVNAFVIHPKAEETVIKQIQRLQGAASPLPDNVDSSSSQLLQEVQAQVKNINRKIEDLTSLPSQVARLMQQLQLLERDFKESVNALNQKMANSENTFSQKVETKFQEILDYVKQIPVSPTPPKPISHEVEQAFLDFLNDREESDLCEIRGIKEKTAEKIISKRPYNSLGDVKKKLGASTTEKWLKSFSEKNL